MSWYTENIHVLGPLALLCLLLFRLFISKKITITTYAEMIIYALISSTIISLMSPLEGLISISSDLTVTENLRALAVLAPLVVILVIGIIFIFESVVVYFMPTKLKGGFSKHLPLIRPILLFVGCNSVFAARGINQGVAVVIFLGAIAFLGIEFIASFHNLRKQLVKDSSRESLLTESFIPYILLGLTLVYIGHAYLGIYGVPTVSLGFSASALFATRMKRTFDEMFVRLIAYFCAVIALFIAYITMNIYYLGSANISHQNIFGFDHLRALLGIVLGALLTIICTAAIMAKNKSYKMLSPQYVIRLKLLAISILAVAVGGFLLGPAGLAGMNLGLLILGTHYQLFFSHLIKDQASANTSISTAQVPLALDFLSATLIFSILFSKIICTI